MDNRLLSLEIEQEHLPVAGVEHPLPPRTPGKCPKPQGPGLCVENCTSDKSCGPGEKCCSNGCGHDCVKVTGGRVALGHSKLCTPTSSRWSTDPQCGYLSIYKYSLIAFLHPLGQWWPTYDTRVCTDTPSHFC
uniref:WAP domain-containing protein n=1 Tax=Anolis carolinensis TaxID=28377 RepID=A0A803TXK7_ANOCA